MSCAGCNAAMDAASLRQFVADVSALRTCDKPDLARCNLLVRAVERFQRSECRRCLGSTTAAVLMCHQCDGWSAPVWVDEYVAHGGEFHKVVTERRLEFLLQHLFFRVRRVHGPDLVHQVCLPARQLDRGKQAWHIFSGISESVSLLRPHVADCVVISMFVQDGLSYASVKRWMRARHEIAHQPGGECFTDDPEEFFEMLTDWNLYLRCKSHQCQLAFQWSLKPMLSHDAVTKDAHNAVRSLRQHGGDIHKQIQAFLVQHVKFVARSGAAGDVEQFWHFLGIPDKLLRAFCLVDPVFRNGSLEVSASIAGREDF